jgi:hypothetical protein
MGSVSFKEVEEAKACLYGSNRLNEKIKRSRKDGYLLFY